MEVGVGEAVLAELTEAVVDGLEATGVDGGGGPDVLFGLRRLYDAISLSTIRRLLECLVLTYQSHARHHLRQYNRRL